MNYGPLFLSSEVIKAVTQVSLLEKRNQYLIFLHLHNLCLQQHMKTAAIYINIIKGHLNESILIGITDIPVFSAILGSFL